MGRVKITLTYEHDDTKHGTVADVVEQVEELAHDELGLDEQDYYVGWENA